LEQVTFKGCFGDGGLTLQNENRRMKLTNVTFLNCSKGIYIPYRVQDNFVSIRNGKFLNGEDGIYINDPYLNIEVNDSTFERMNRGIGNSESYNAKLIRLNNVYFQHNRYHIYYSGNSKYSMWRLRETVFNNGSVFLKNVQDFMVVDGMFIAVANFTVINSKFNMTGSSYDSSYGMRFEDSELLLKRSSFEENRSGNQSTVYYGGGALSIKNTKVAINDCTFMRNNGLRGGAIYCESGNGNVFDSDFEYNIVKSGGGGAFFCEHDCELFMVNNKYYKNEPRWSSEKCEMN